MIIFLADIIIQVFVIIMTISMSLAITEFCHLLFIIITHKLRR